MTFNALLVEDSQSLGALYSEYLRDEGGQVTHVNHGEDALSELARTKPDLLLLDIRLPDMSGMDILEQVMKAYPGLTVIMMTAHGTIDIAVDAMRLGAFDFLVKPFDGKRLGITVRNALKQRELEALVSRYEKSLPTANFCGFIGESLAMQTVYRTIENVAHSKASVFITGESGTGKEVCAQAIHQSGQRSEAPFVALNCASIPHELMESEIFGHVKGAFTGATHHRQGAAARSNGGTLFLDEICEMDLDLQAKLLRFIQTGTYTPVGGSREETVNVRFVAATNRDPWKEVKAGRFREDLYYRLYVIPLELPPLRARGRDLLLLAKKFLRDYSREEGKHFKALSPECARLMSLYPWPGNVRQLQNVMRQMVVLNQGDTLTDTMLPEPLRSVCQGLAHQRPTSGGLTSQESISQASINQVQSSQEQSSQEQSYQEQSKQEQASEEQPSPAANVITAKTERLFAPSASAASWHDERPITTALSALSAEDALHLGQLNNGGTSQLTQCDGIKPLWIAEKEIIEQAIEACDGNIPKAAALLDISPSTIYRKRQSWEEAELLASQI